MLINTDKILSDRVSKLTDITDNADIESSWSAFRSAVYESSYEILGDVKRKYQNWFDSTEAIILPLMNKQHH